jgi:acyl-CoA thioesterase-2
MGTDLDRLVELLDLEPLEVNLFRGTSPTDRRRERVFGGQVLAQALVAAGRTVEPDRRVHSLHSYFLRPGDPRAPIVFDVDRIRDGRSFTTRRVVAIQHGQAIFNLQASFQVAEVGPEHADPMPDVPPPEEIAALTAPSARDVHADAEASRHAPWPGDRPIDLRYVQGPHWEPGAREPDQDVWLRADGTLADDPLLHAAVVAYASDFMLLGTSTLPHREEAVAPRADSEFMVASLDHVMWFHRPCRADEWLLYHCHSPSAGAARGFARGEVFRRDGTLCATIAQEGLVRPLGT